MEGIRIKLETFVESHNQPYVVIDSDYRIVAFNTAFEETFRVSRYSAILQPCYRLIRGKGSPCTDLNSPCPHQPFFNGGEIQPYVYIHHDTNGLLYHVYVEGEALEDHEGKRYLGESIHVLSSANPQNQKSLIGSSRVFLQTLERLIRASMTEAPVLILGETGTGKELAANYIHDLSARSDKPFITIDCATLTESLFEAELFGHERGAFTGTVRKKRGLLELANGGSVFFDEIGELSVAAQSKLLRVLETGEFRRVGSNRHQKVNTRVICASNRDLRIDSTFRRDLYYRVAANTIRLPPLRDRRGDIPQLNHALLSRLPTVNRLDYTITPEAMEFLLSHQYPGNIRELRNLLWNAASHSRNGRIGIAELRGLPAFVARTVTENSARRRIDPLATVQERPDLPTEARKIYKILVKYGGNRRQSARALGISERTLYRKLKIYGLNNR